MIVAVGDVQGCAAALQRLMQAVGDRPDRRWWFCGDLVNRGPASLATLRLVRDLGPRAVTVLGNHDLHLLAVAYGVRKAGRSDTLDEILAAPDRDELLDWLRHRPLIHHAHSHLLVHAGLLPEWTVEQAEALARELETHLRGADCAGFLASIFKPDPPVRWSPTLETTDRLRIAVNAMTRLRFCSRDGVMNLRNTDGPQAAGPNELPWFDLPQRRSTQTTIVFGHWAALGLKLAPNLVATDTGCVWGGSLTAVELTRDPTARRVWQVRCDSPPVPKQ